MKYSIWRVTERHKKLGDPILMGAGLKRYNKKLTSLPDRVREKRASLKIIPLLRDKKLHTT
jgi:hypothetical protein